MTIGKEQKTVVVIDVPIPAHALAHIHTYTYIHTQLIVPFAQNGTPHVPMAMELI